LRAGSGSSGQGTLFGASAPGTAALPNLAGVAVNGSGHRIGGTAAGEGNLISGNRVHGIRLTNFSTANQVQGNRIGTDLTGSVALPNASAGVEIDDGASNNLIGGVTPGTGNRIAFNTGPGVGVDDANSLRNAVRGNAIWGNGGLGIDLGLDGVTPNDPGGGPRPGPNHLQNAPVITGVTRAGGGVAIRGTLKSIPNTAFQIDFYANRNPDPSGYG